MKPNQRRSTLDIILEMLSLEEASKTQIMYASNMSYSQIQKYLQFLVDRGFMDRIVKPNPGVKYRITPKGRSLLGRIEAVQELLLD